MASQPNLIFILLDDMGWRDLTCYGSTFHETPHIDALASRGMRFTNAYAACPVCSPTRASMMTGQYPARLGLTQYIGGNNRGKLLDVPYVRQLDTSIPNVAHLLKSADYHTWHVGKWHLGDQPFWPERQGFDCNIGGKEWGMPHKGPHRRGDQADRKQARRSPVLPQLLALRGAHSDSSARAAGEKIRTESARPGPGQTAGNH
jgi:arylsulfatase A-like enzyme